MTDSAPAARYRTLWARLRRRSGDDGRDACGEPWMLGFGLAASGSAEAVSGLAGPERPEIHDPERANVLVGRDAEDHPVPPRPEAFRAEPQPTVRAAPEALEDNRTLVEALYRVAESFERVADSIDADRRARRATLDDVDSLLRALVGELRSPPAVAPVILAGTIDASGRDAIDLAAVEGPDVDRRPFERARRS